MGYYSHYKMLQIVGTLLWVTFLGTSSCHPNRDNVKLPDLDVSKPEEVNSLEREEPLRVSPGPRDNIEDTVREVEEIIRSNPALPRLTRGEILDLLENITSIDEQKKKVLGKNRNPKAVIVVMPYTPTNENNMEDLYTKAPVTQIIGAEYDKEKNLRNTPLVQVNDTDNDLAQKPLHVEERKKYSASISEKFTKPTLTRNSVRRKRPEATISPTTYHPTTKIITGALPTTRKPIRRRTTTQQHPNHRYQENFVPENGIRIIESPQLATTRPENYFSLPDLDLQENVRQEVVIRQQTPKPSAFVTSKPSNYNVLNSKPLKEETVIEGINLPDNLKTVVKDLNLEGALNSKKEELIKNIEEQNRIRNILASVGIISNATTTTTTTSVPNAENIADSLSPEMRELLISFGLLPNPHEKPVVIETPKFYPEKAEVKPESYIGFKPLPEDGPSRDDMDALFASFGLGRSARKGKSANRDAKKSEETLNFDMIPEHLKTVIDDLGISGVNREEKGIRSTSTEKTAEKQHVFSPEAQYATEEELKKLEKLIAMIKSLEKMNGTASEEDLKKLDLGDLKELVANLNGQNNEPIVPLDEKDVSLDPNDFDRGINKNEVKRQEVSSTETSISSTVEESSIKSTVESETPSIKDLEASFGGNAEAEIATLPPVPEVTTRKSGFYYLVDWNTFLDIDDTKGKRVNLRFQPTIGDPKRFLSVSVP